MSSKIPVSKIPMLSTETVPRYINTHSGTATSILHLFAECLHYSTSCFFTSLVYFFVPVQAACDVCLHSVCSVVTGILCQCDRFLSYYFPLNTLCVCSLVGILDAFALFILVLFVLVLFYYMLGNLCPLYLYASWIPLSFILFFLPSTTFVKYAFLPRPFLPPSLTPPCLLELSLSSPPSQPSSALPSFSHSSLPPSPTPLRLPHTLSFSLLTVSPTHSLSLSLTSPFPPHSSLSSCP